MSDQKKPQKPTFDPAVVKAKKEFVSRAITKGLMSLGTEFQKKKPLPKKGD